MAHQIAISVEWRECRNGELFFVRAELSSEGWSFAERSTYEVRWYDIQKTVERVEHARALSPSGAAG